MLSLSPDLVLCAYAIGMFPMANDRDDPTVHWVEPKSRGVIPLSRFHVPASLRKVIRQRRFELSVDSAFAEVITACAEARPERPRTWLNDELIELYCTLHRQGHAHSVECWRDGRFAGGLYGVSMGAAFFGESMVSFERDASKVALVHLVERLRLGRYRLLDTQFITDHLRRFGAIEVPRDTYRTMLRRALAGRATFYPGAAVPASSPTSTGSSQSTTQTS